MNNPYREAAEAAGWHRASDDPRAVSPIVHDDFVNEFDSWAECCRAMDTQVDLPEPTPGTIWTNRMTGETLISIGVAQPQGGDAGRDLVFLTPFSAPGESFQWVARDELTDEHDLETDIGRRVSAASQAQEDAP